MVQDLTPSVSTVDILSKLKLPGETVRLPSAGLLYIDVLDDTVVDGEVYIYPMSSYDEIILKTPDKLFSGNGIVEVIKRCVPQIKQPHRLFVKDVEYIIVSLRKITYGNTYEITYTHDCETAKKQHYSVNMSVFLNQNTPLDPVTLASNPYTLVMDNQQVIVMAPITYSDFIDLQQLSVLSESSEETKQDSLIQYYYKGIAAGIESIDGETSKSSIIEWCKAAPPTWVNVIIERLSGSSHWGLDTNYTITCKDCGEQTKVALELNPIIFFSE
jgi:hypothetical protein